MPLKEQNGHVGTIGMQTASRHRAGSSYAIHPEDTPDTTAWDHHTTGRQQAATRMVFDEIDNPPRMPSSARRYRTTTEEPDTVMQVTHHHPPAMKRRASARTPAPPTTLTTRPPQTPVTRSRPTRRVTGWLARRRLHWTIYTGLALMIAISGWVVINLVMSWWSVTLDYWHYGNPRTAQY